MDPGGVETASAELFEALCLATVFESSGRSRSLIYDAMSSVMENPLYRDEIRSIVERLSRIVSRDAAFTDLRAAARRLEILRAALGLDGDVRIRICRFDDVHHPGGQHTVDWRLPSVDAVRPAALRPVVEQLGSVVLVGPRAHSDVECTISLDYHRYAWTPDSTPKTPPSTATGGLVILEKPQERELRVPGGPDAVRVLAGRLATVVKLNTAYSRASAIAIVPGSSGDFSNRLGAQVAALAGMHSVLLQQSFDESAGAAFSAPSPVEGCVIVVDDVYRTGRTLELAATALRNAGARQVLGLTATCTISPLHDDACGDDRKPPRSRVGGA